MSALSYLTLSLLSVVYLPLRGQAITIDSPVSRIVFQRSNTNSALVPVRGTLRGGVTRVQGRLLSRTGGQTTAWYEGAVKNGGFSLNIPAVGGLYDLELVAIANGQGIERQRRERIGVGEVFVVSGQSNNFGQSGRGLPANDDRVSVVNYWPGDAGHVDERALPMAFAQAGPGTFCGPRNPLYIWGGLGDRLVAKLGVPVLFLGAAHPGSSSQNWREAALGAEQVSGRDWTNNIPYRPLRLALQVYGGKTGVRGVLWHQGESDNSFRTTEGYMQNIRVLIDKSRQDSNYDNLSWMIARASYYPFYSGHEYDPDIVKAQNGLIATVNNCFPGPATDDFVGPAYRGDLIHFTEHAYNFLADLWNQSLTHDYFSQATPSLPPLGPASAEAEPVKEADVTSAVGGPLRVTIPAYNCQTGEITFMAAGGTGEPVNFLVPGVTGWTTTATHVLGEGLRRDAQTLTIWARQFGQQASMVWNLRAACAGLVVSPPLPSTAQSVGSPNPSGTSVPVSSGTSPAGGFALITPDYSCQTGTITFKTSATPGASVEFLAPGVTGWTTTATHVLGEGLRRDAQTLTIWARQSGQQASMIWNLRSFCNGSTPGAQQATNSPPANGSHGSASLPPTSQNNSSGSGFIVTAPTYDCPTGAITFTTSGGTGEPVSFLVPGVTGWTTTATHVLGEGLRRDAQTLTIWARQSGKQVSMVWNLRAACATVARVAREADEKPLLVWPNPAAGQIQLEWPDAVTSPWTSQFLDARGGEVPLIISANQKGLNTSIRHLPTGVYLWQILIPGRPTQSFRVVKIE